MTNDELASIALRYRTVMADAMLRALGVTRPRTQHGKTRDRSAKFRKYGVRL